MVIDIAAYEDAIVAKIATDNPVLNAFPLARVSDLRDASLRKPAVGVIFIEDDFDDPTLIGPSTYQEGKLSWYLYPVAESLRGPIGGRRGALGAYDIAMMVLGSMCPTLSVRWGVVPGCPMRYKGKRLFDLASDPALAIYEMRFEHDFVYTEV